MRSGTLEHSEQYNEIKDLRGTLLGTFGTLDIVKVRHCQVKQDFPERKKG